MRAFIRPLRDQILYPDLHPAIFEDEGILTSHHLPVYPLPKTAQSCKRNPGFLFPKNDERDAHGVRDSLIDWALFKIGESPAYQGTGINPLIALREHKRCTSCDEAMDHFPGYYRRADTRLTHSDDGTKFYSMFQAEAHTRLQTHTGIDRESGIVQDGILYNREVFAEETRFWGMVKILDDGELFSRFKKFIEDIGQAKTKEERNDGEIDHGGLVRIGTGRTRGMGWVEFQVQEMPTESTDRLQSFTERLKAFDDLLQKQAQYFKLGDLEQFFFALTLHSPLILCDDLLRYRNSIDEQALVELGVEIAGLQLRYQATSMRRLSGWLEIWGLPRINEYAIDTGSVFLFSCPQPSAEQEEALFQALFTLEEDGAGKRRAEGFGRVCVSDQFHQEIVLR